MRRVFAQPSRWQCQFLNNALSAWCCLPNGLAMDFILGLLHVFWQLPITMRYLLKEEADGSTYLYNLDSASSW